jgi:hypothetical protein
MKITVRLDTALLALAKREAANRRETLTSLIEQGLRLVLAQSRSPQSRREHVVLPTCSLGGGLLPGVDLADNTSLLDVMEERR